MLYRVLMRTQMQVCAVLDMMDSIMAGAHVGFEVACVYIFCSENF